MSDEARPGPQGAAPEVTGQGNGLNRCAARSNLIGSRLIGWRVVTVKPEVESRDWTSAARVARLWGAAGTIIARNDAHGEVYQVRHDVGGEAWYEARELEAEPAVPAEARDMHPAIEKVATAFAAEGKRVEYVPPDVGPGEGHTGGTMRVSAPPREVRREVELGDESDASIEALRANAQLNAQYASLRAVLDRALEQASVGKGAQRHGHPGVAFEEQPTMRICEWLGSNHFALGQAIKKLRESARLPKERAVLEIIGSIVYACHAVIMLEEKTEEEKA